MTRSEKLARLTGLARLKADHAKAGLAAARGPVERLSREIEALCHERQARATETPDPAGAAALAAWRRQADRRLLELSAELARARVALETQLDIARHEEGRCQVLKKLRDQAS